MLASLAEHHTTASNVGRIPICRDIMMRYTEGIPLLPPLCVSMLFSPSAIDLISAVSPSISSKRVRRDCSYDY